METRSVSTSDGTSLFFSTIRNTVISCTVLPSATLSVDGAIFATHVTLATSSTKRCFLRAFTSRFL